MTTIASGRLPETLQSLVNARLDTIDRMLMGRVPRADRLAIVREVEAQIHDHLGERGAGPTDRDDVLAALARLDPPEAYLPEESTADPALATRPPAPRPSRPSRGGDDRVARIGGILGLVGLAMVFVSVAVFFLAQAIGSEVLFYVGCLGSAGLTFVAGLLAVVLATYSRFKGPWAIIGLVSGGLATIATVGGIGLLLLNL